MYVEVTDASGTTSWELQGAEDTAIQDDTASLAAAVVGTASDDYDTWCETTPICGRKISSSIAEVKGNVSYGSNGVETGKFDVVWRQNFNGPYQRWRLCLIWDGGPAVDGDTFKAQTRREVALASDPYYGKAYFYPAAISSISWRAWYPSSTGYIQSDLKVNTNGTYHDDLTGSFYAAGYHWTISGTPHTGHWDAKYSSSLGSYTQTYSKVPY